MKIYLSFRTGVLTLKAIRTQRNQEQPGMTGTYRKKYNDHPHGKEKL